MNRIPLFVFLCLAPVFLLECPKAEENIWLSIDTQKLQLEIKQGNKTLAVMKNIAIGRNGAGFKQSVGDDITPLGDYKITWVNVNSLFHRFYGFNYPSEKNADQALSAGLLDQQAHAAIIAAHRQHKTPPHSTPLGGRIGIHGLGNADERIHNLVNWTHGCIALTNAQIDRLAPWITDNMRVKIK